MNTNELHQLLEQLAAPAAWHGLTMAHAFVAALAGWITHTNWPKVIRVGTWVVDSGGVVGIVRKVIGGRDRIADSQEPIAKAGPEAGAAL